MLIIGMATPHCINNQHDVSIIFKVLCRKAKLLFCTGRGNEKHLENNFKHNSNALKK